MLYNSNIRKALTSVFIILVGSLVLSLIRNNKNSSSDYQIASKSIKSEDSNPKQVFTVNSEIYVPSVTIVKGTNFNGTDCAKITYIYNVENTSNAAEVLINVQVTDMDLGGIVPSFVSGDDNANGHLDPGEKWDYTAEYILTQNDLENGSFGMQPANVTADVQGQGIQVTDNSHPSDPSSQGPTIVDLTPCQIASIGLIKDWSYVDLDGGNPPCAENFLYTFQVENLGNFDLQNLELSDPLLGGEVPGPTPLSDIGNDGILSPGEIWEYQALYSADLLISGTVRNQAEVTAETRQGTPISDLSDNDSYLENDETTAPYDEVCTGAFARIGLIKTVSASIDTDNDNCDDTIQYTFTVRNVREAPLEEVVLTDPLLGGEITNRTDDGDGDDILAPNEEWIYQVEYMVTPDDIVNGSVPNRALVQAKIVGFDIFLFDYSDNDSFDENDETVEQVDDYCSTPRIGLIKSFNTPLEDLDGDVCPEIINYFLTVRNVGNIPLDQVVVDDPQLSNLLVGPQNDVGNDDVLSPGEEWVFQASYPITDQDIAIGSITNSASVSAFEEGTSNEITDVSHDLSFDEDGNTTVLIACSAQAEVALLKISNGTLDIDNNGCVETIEYEFRVRNTGEISLSSVNITDLDFAIAINGPNNDDGDGVLSPNEEWMYLGYYSLTEQDINTMSVTNRAEVTAQDTFFNNSITDLSDYENFTLNRQTVTSTIGACFAESSIGLIKVASSVLEDINNDGCPENIPYIFTINNTGSIPLEQVVLTDELLGTDTIDGPLPGNDINSDEILSPGETWTYLSLYPITEGNIADTVVRNQANVVSFEQGTANFVSDASDDNSFDENDETITSVVGACSAEADISFIKNATPIDSDGDGCPETIRYSFVVDNAGAIDLHQVAINDDLLVGPINGPLNSSDINNDSVLSISETWVFEAEYTITQVDYDEGSVTNQAQVSALEVITNNSIQASSEEVTTSLGDICEEPVDPSDTNFEIFNGITPNGDGLNDFFEIKGIENYPNNTLQIFNRWGVLVYEAQGYGVESLLFIGQSEGRATISEERSLPTGTYFYTLVFNGDNPGQEVYSGYLYLSQN